MGKVCDYVWSIDKDSNRISGEKVSEDCPGKPEHNNRTLELRRSVTPKRDTNLGDKGPKVQRVNKTILLRKHRRTFSPVSFLQKVWNVRTLTENRSKYILNILYYTVTSTQPIS